MKWWLLLLLVGSVVADVPSGFYGLYYTLTDARNPPVNIISHVSSYNNVGYKIGSDHPVEKVPYNQSNLIVDNICTTDPQTNKFYYSKGDPFVTEVTIDGDTAKAVRYSIDPYVVLSMGMDRMITMYKNEGWIYTLKGKAFTKITISYVDYSYPIVFTNKFMLYKPLGRMYSMVTTDQFSTVPFSSIPLSGAPLYMTTNGTHHIIFADMNIQDNTGYSIIFYETATGSATTVPITGITSDMLITTVGRDNNTGIFFISTTKGLYLSFDDGEAMPTATGMNTLNCLSFFY